MAGTGAVLPPARSWLYAPGNNPRLLEKVFSAGADGVVLDLEDAVPASEKERALDLVTAAVRGREGQPGPLVFVRICHPSSGLAENQVKAIVGPGLDGIRLPKAEHPDEVELVDSWITLSEAHTNRAIGSISLVCNIESARGIWNAAEIASARPRVHSLAFGASDFAADLGLNVGPDATESLYARSRLVLASRVAGVAPPIDSVYTRLDDEEGLERTTRQGRALGFMGRSAIHPRQVSIINRVYTPTEEDVARAREVVDAARDAEETQGSGSIRLPNGDFVDLAIVRRALATLDLASRIAGS